MTTRNWRDVARVARLHKFDRFNKANSEEENVKPVRTTATEPEKQPTVEPSKPIPHARFASMDFRRTNNGEASGVPEVNKRASWSSTANHANPAARVSSRPPPPPPPPKQKEEPQTEARTAPQLPKKPVEATQPDTKPRSAYIKHNESENTPSIGTPTKSKSETPKISTPLQERTNIPVEPPIPSTKKNVATFKSKSFAKLLKENGLSYYEMLEIPEYASEKDILKAFRSWAKLVHPDHNKEPTATEDFQALQQIYDILKTPKTRLAYNCRQKIRRCAFGGRARPQTTTV
jgi:hypothetical protein